MHDSPSPNGSNGNGSRPGSPDRGDRDSQGRFAKGNPGGPGNPRAKQAADLRQTFLDTVRRKDLRDIVQALIKRAKEGDVMAVREILNRTLGRPDATAQPPTQPQRAGAMEGGPPISEEQLQKMIETEERRFNARKRDWPEIEQFLADRDRGREP